MMVQSENSVSHPGITELGSKALCEAISCSPSGPCQEALAQTLHGRVLELAGTPCGSEVLRTCVRCLPSPTYNFILKELEGRGAQAARHAYAHKVLCTIFETAPLGHAAVLVAEVIGCCESTVDLCKNRFGSRVFATLWASAHRRDHLALLLGVEISQEVDDCWLT